MSRFLSLAKNDFVKGLVIAVLGTVLFAVKEAIENGGFSAIEWGNVLTLAVLAGLTYLIKNFFTNSNGELGKAE